MELVPDLGVERRPLHGAGEVVRPGLEEACHGAYDLAAHHLQAVGGPHDDRERVLLGAAMELVDPPRLEQQAPLFARNQYGTRTIRPENGAQGARLSGIGGMAQWVAAEDGRHASTIGGVAAHDSRDGRHEDRVRERRRVRIGRCVPCMGVPPSARADAGTPGRCSAPAGCGGGRPH